MVSRGVGLPRDVAVCIRTPDGREHRARSGSDGAATLEGDPGELLLYLGGRRGASTARLGGDATAVERVAAGQLGF